MEQDLKMWSRLGLGQLIYSGSFTELPALGIFNHPIKDVKAVLELANGQ